MDALPAYLSDHPLLALFLLALVLSIVWSVMKKLVRLGLILAVVFLSAGGATYHVAHLELAEKGRQWLKRAETEIESKVRGRFRQEGDTTASRKDSLR